MELIEQVLLLKITFGYIECKKKNSSKLDKRIDYIPINRFYNDPRYQLNCYSEKYKPAMT